MTISSSSRQKMSFYVGREADEEISNHIIMAKTKTEERQENEDQKSTKKKIRLDIHSILLKKITTKIKRRKIKK